MTKPIIIQRLLELDDALAKAKVKEFGAMVQVLKARFVVQEAAKIITDQYEELEGRK